MNNRESAGWPASLLPRLARSAVVITPPGDGPGYWAGGPSAVLTGEGIYLAYRLRRPVGSGRGYAVADPGEPDQRTTEYATSADGLDWIWHGTALSGRSGRWDARGTRVSAVCYADDAAGATIAAFYDGRASAAENFEERTGIATGTEPAALAATGTAAAAESPYAGRGLRYLDVLPLGDGRHRLYYEVTRPDGAHELRTELR